MVHHHPETPAATDGVRRGATSQDILSAATTLCVKKRDPEDVDGTNSSNQSQTPRRKFLKHLPAIWHPLSWVVLGTTSETETCMLTTYNELLGSKKGGAVSSSRGVYLFRKPNFLLSLYWAGM